MEKWETVERPPMRRACDYPSFSSTLLDSIYRSIDEDETNRQPAARLKPYRGAPDHLISLQRQKQTSFTSIDTKWTAAAAVNKRPSTREAHRGAPDSSSFLLISSEKKKHSAAPVTRLHSATSSSSECSSYGGFSSSEADSSSAHPDRLKPIRTAGFPNRSLPQPPPPPPPLPEEKKKNPTSIRSKFRDLRKSRSPKSPGARLASFLNSLFFAAAGNSKRPKSAAAAAGDDSASSTASSYSRSCLIKTPSTRGRAAADGVRRSVRFYDPSLDLRPDPPLPPAPPQEAATMKGVRRREYGKRVEELSRRFEGEEDEDAGSDSSSDLFELKNLTAAGHYRHELPVYGTTHLAANRTRAIAHELTM